MPRLLAALLATALLSACSSPQPPAMPDHQAGETQHIRFASTDGRFVGLDDGSLWNIDWRHADTVARWAAGERIRVTRTPENSFPYRLTDNAGNHAGARHGKRLD